MNLKKYGDLPDYMNTVELEVCFCELLDFLETNQVNPEEAVEALFELANRQWHTYELLSEPIKIRVEGWLKNVWNLESLKFVSYSISVIAHLGLTNTYLLLKQSLAHPLSSDVRQEIEETIAELDDNIADPYSGMKK